MYYLVRIKRALLRINNNKKHFITAPYGWAEGGSVDKTLRRWRRNNGSLTYYCYYNMGFFSFFFFLLWLYHVGHALLCARARCNRRYTTPRAEARETRRKRAVRNALGHTIVSHGACVREKVINTNERARIYGELTNARVSRAATDVVQ